MGIPTEIEYSIYYETLPARTITNIVGPRDYSCNDERALAREERLLAKKPDFYASLEKSILDRGVIDPIIIVRNKWFRMEWGIDDTGKPACPQFGGSRLWVCQKHDLTIPVIVCDYDGLHHNLNIDDYFTNPIKYIKYKHYIEAQIVDRNL